MNNSALSSNDYIHGAANDTNIIKKSFPPMKFRTFYLPNYQNSTLAESNFDDLVVVDLVMFVRKFFKMDQNSSVQQR